MRYWLTPAAEEPFATKVTEICPV
jgi:hypothetical protein